MLLVRKQMLCINPQRHKKSLIFMLKAGSELTLLFLYQIKVIIYLDATSEEVTTTFHPTALILELIDC